MLISPLFLHYSAKYIFNHSVFHAYLYQMKSKKITLIITAAAVVVGASVWFFLTRNSNLPKYIPNSALAVFKINPLSIGRKIDFDEIKKLKSFESWKKEMVKNDVKFMDAIEKPKESGLSLTDNIYIFTENDGEKSDFTVGAVIPVSNAENLKKFIEKVAKNANMEYEKDGDLHIMSQKEEAQPENDEMSEYSYRYKPQVTTLVWNDEACLVYTTRNNSKKTAKKIMKQTKEQSMLSMESFNNAESEGGDASVFVNYHKYVDLINKSAGMQTLYPEALKKFFDNISGSAFVINFNDNDITTETFMYNKDEKMAKEYAFLQNTGLSEENMEMLSPDGKLLIGFGGMLNMETFFKMLKSLPKYKTAIKEIAQTSGLTESELETFLDGSIAFALTKLNTKQVEEMVYNYEKFDMETGEFESSMQTVTKVVPVMTAQIGIKDEKLYKKLIAQLEKMTNGMIKENNGIITIPTGTLFGNVSMTMAKNKIVFTNDEESAKILAKNKTWNNQIDKTVAKMFTTNPSSAFLDLKMSSYGEGTLKKWMGISDENENFTQIKDVMSNFSHIAVTGNMKNSTAVIQFTESNDNTIMSLFKIADKISTAERKKRAEREARMRELESQLNQEAIDSTMSDATMPDNVEPATID